MNKLCFILIVIAILKSGSSHVLKEFPDSFSDYIEEVAIENNDQEVNKIPDDSPQQKMLQVIIEKIEDLSESSKELKKKLAITQKQMTYNSQKFDGEREEIMKLKSNHEIVVNMLMKLLKE